MLLLVFWFSVFAVSLFVLIRASHYFTESAQLIGLMLGISPFIIGVTIVSVGTSLPELIASIVAVMQGATEIVVGNVVGSNVANIFLILGIGAIVANKLHIDFELINVDLPLLIGSAFLLMITFWDGVFSFGEALLLLGGLVVFTGYNISNANSERRNRTSETPDEPFRLKPVLILIISSVFVYVGAKYTIDAVIRLAELLNTGREVVAITAVAVGTSLPELTVTIVAARSGKGELVVGNVLGSNIFNTFAVMGIPGLIHSLEVPPSVITIGVPMMVIASVMFFATTQDKQVSRWEGAMFLIFYVLFIGKIVHLF